MIFSSIKRDRHKCAVKLTLTGSTSLSGVSGMKFCEYESRGSRVAACLQTDRQMRTVYFIRHSAEIPRFWKGKIVPIFTQYIRATNYSKVTSHELGLETELPGSTLYVRNELNVSYGVLQVQFCFPNQSKALAFTDNFSFDSAECFYPSHLE